jgi:glycine reductase
MDLAHQEAILKVVQERGKENVVVVLGSPDPESAELAAETVVNGDPTFAGPLAGVSLGLPVYHILEPEVRQAVDPKVYRDAVGLMEAALPAAEISAVVRRIRGSKAE